MQRTILLAMFNILRRLYNSLYGWLKIVLISIIFIILIFLIYQIMGLFQDLRDPRSQTLFQWSNRSEAERNELITIQRDACPGAPFILPADGYIGLLYADPRGPYSQAQPHQGIDIFSNSEPGITPVFAAYNGYITREEEWRSSLILRVPQDPLQPERQIWLYYTHMANQEGDDFIIDAFPPGTKEMYVEQGTLLGYTGDYNGDSLRTIWVHLHFSLVLDDGRGQYLNELDIANTVDPSPYLGMMVNYNCETEAEGCTADPVCANS